MTKMSLVILGAISAAILQTSWAVSRPVGDGRSPQEREIHRDPVHFFWTMAIVSGRLTAYI